jgi:DNA-binding GntR family transcriptional regulator
MAAKIERPSGDSVRFGNNTTPLPSRKPNFSAPRAAKKAAMLEARRSSAASDFTDDRIDRRIRDAVMAGHLPPGTKLAEEPLAAAFGTNRLRIREVLRLLNFAGIVEIIPNRGAFIAKPNRREAMDTYRARRLIEAEIVRLASDNLSRSGLAVLRRHVALQRAAELSGDRALFVRLIGEFHIVLAEIAANEVLASFVSQLVARTSLIIMLYERPGRVGCAVNEHAALIDMIEKGNVAGAVAAMNHHLSAIEERLMVEAPPEKLAIDFRTLFAAAE